MKQKILWTMLLAFIGFILAAEPALAGGPKEWGLNMQPAATSSAERIHAFHDMLLVIISVITVFVLFLLMVVVLRYNRHVNKTPSKVTHNVLLEVIWTVIPIVILIIIAIPSFKLLYKNDKITEPEMTLKVTGYQWYWGYEYPDHDGITFDARMVPDDEIQQHQKRLLSTDNVVVLPIDTDIALLVTANDVLHAWTIPAFGVKIDAIPGRTNETWFNIKKRGIYYGQCSELCGKDHSYMPIEIHAVSKEEFKVWLERAKQEYSANDNFEQPTKLAVVAQ